MNPITIGLGCNIDDDLLLRFLPLNAIQDAADINNAFVWVGPVSLVNATNLDICHNCSLCCDFWDTDLASCRVKKIQTVPLPPGEAQPQITSKNTSDDFNERTIMANYDYTTSGSYIASCESTMQPLYSVRDGAGAGEIKRGPVGTGLTAASGLPSGQWFS